MPPAVVVAELLDLRLDVLDDRVLAGLMTGPRRRRAYDAPISLQSDQGFD